MSDSEDEVFNCKKQRQSVISSDEEENDEKSSINGLCVSQLPSQTCSLMSSSYVEASNQFDDPSLNVEKYEKLPQLDHPKCTSDSDVNQGTDKFHFYCSAESDQSSQRSANKQSFVKSTKFKLCSNSSGSNSESESSRSTLISHRSFSQRSSQRSSPHPDINSQNSDKNLNFEKSSFVDSEFDFSSKKENKTCNAGLNSTEIINQFISEEKSDNLSQAENITKPKVNKYKLLSDDDLSEEEGIHFPVIRRNSGSESDNNCIQNLDPAVRIKLEKQKRKKKLQLLNELKKKEFMEKSETVSSDSDCESRETFNPSIEKQNGSSTASSKNTTSSDSENEVKKSKKKSDGKSQSQRKSKKADPMLEIKSNTQKMIRENRISLPYHQPKKRSLDEFLERRKKIQSIPLKTTSDVLHVVSEHLLEREKEVAIFYKSESDHSDDDARNVSDVDQTVNSSVVDIESNVEFPQKTSRSENHNATGVQNNSRDFENDTEILREINRSEENESVAMNNSNFDIASSHTELPDRNRKYLVTNLSVVDKVMSEEFAENIPVDDTNSISYDEAMDVDPDDIRLETHMIEKSSSHIQPENNSSEYSKIFKDNRELNSCITTPTIAEVNLPNSGCCIELIMKAQEETSIYCGFRQENSSEKSPVKEPEQNRSVPPDTDDFDLMIQDSCHDTKKDQFDSNTVTPDPKTDLRSKKLALLSRLNIPLRSDVKLLASPDSIVEFDTPFKSKSELGVFELKQKFSHHSTIHSKPVRKSCTKLSIIRTEKDSQGEVINIVKETIDVSCGEANEDEEKEKFLTPGAKHLNFREYMLKSLVAKKHAKWQEYQLEKRKLCGVQSSDDEEFDDECSQKSDFEPYHPEDELDDDELEEDDVEMKDKKSVKNDYVDDEAEVSFDEDENMKDSNVEDDDEDSEKDIEADEPSDNIAEVEDEDSDAEILNSKQAEKTTYSNLSSNTTNETFKKPLFSLFKHNTTGIDLENKVLGFENVFAQESQNSDEVTCSQLFEICSGKFASQEDQLNTSDPSDIEFFTDSQHVEDSQNINLSLQDTNDGCKTSDLNIPENRDSLFFSDESDTEELFARKKKSMRLDDSDDETEEIARVGDAKSSDDEKNDDADEPNDDENEDEVDALVDDDEELAYNSEEEIITKEKAAEFFENEAELSESEWDSEDENEQNLDNLEKEAGDDDILDEDELKEELGKIHMRQLLDDDHQNVRMLKEMLLEDGELHSDGKRQRKFQWTNLDDKDFFSKTVNDSDEEVLKEDDEEETDINWRKIRHEREMYISQQEKRDSLMEEAEDGSSDSLPLPVQNVSKSPVNSSKSNLNNNHISSPNLKLPFKARFKCGSFLTRSKMLLNRLAATVSECKENVTGGAKNHRNFVFAAVSPEKKLPDVPETKTEKRKISSKSVKACKKLKLTPSTYQRGLLAQLALSE